MQEITVTLPVETVNAAIAALSKMPYEFALPHITVIQQRGNAALLQQTPQPASDSNYGGNE